jgi:predicted nucleic acid-binding protein
LTGFVVIDTNVLVSGLVRGHEDSPTKRIVQAMIGGHLRFLLSDDMLREYRRALLKPSIAQRHGLTEADVDDLLLEIILNATMREPSAGEDPVPAGDAHVADLLRTMPGCVLVTGDRRLADAVRTWCEVVTPAAFAAALGV